jgi:hypothetical protein
MKIWSDTVLWNDNVIIKYELIMMSWSYSWNYVTHKGEIELIDVEGPVVTVALKGESRLIDELIEWFIDFFVELIDGLIL